MSSTHVKRDTRKPNSSSTHGLVHVSALTTLPDAQSAPALHFPGAKPDQAYMVVNIDPDAPFPSMAFLGPILHWVQPGLKAASDDNGLSVADGEPHVANYTGPGPPPLSSPHRYIFLLYEQPAGWDVARAELAGVKRGADVGHGPRMRFDLDGWIAQTGLGEPVAGNWFVSR
jgi:phosphatidylethanolamine-binding protein